MDKIIKVRITYNTGFVLETNMSEYTFDYYAKYRNPLYNPKYPSIDVNVEDTEYVSLYGAVKLERCE
jgi:hypothetical protein